ncbi:hypothetical protein P171DRAFT_120148 [Karstenula rhodostoma CBS 690.94]|uniref:Uncharacterized protein n=1 Tax=Karstenula rhodostoma CBS 690.94 TaxID=1392251 RepID=A0A9P4PA94_9PLEO|nr:hypothetical protein P171DRAFT_120148 [Karstenula rhodostoma CBS 690.94]
MSSHPTNGTTAYQHHPSSHTPHMKCDLVPNQKTHVSRMRNIATPPHEVPCSLPLASPPVLILATSSPPKGDGDNDFESCLGFFVLGSAGRRQTRRSCLPSPPPPRTQAFFPPPTHLVVKER